MSKNIDINYSLIRFLLWRVLFIVSLPLLTAFNKAHGTESTDKVDQAQPINPVASDFVSQWYAQHPHDAVVIACLVCWVIGSVIGTFMPTPDDMKNVEIPKLLRFVICLAGGIAAFLYLSHVDKSLTLLTPLWVGGVSFIAPQIIQDVHELIRQRFGFKVNSHRE